MAAGNDASNSDNNIYVRPEQQGFCLFLGIE